MPADRPRVGPWLRRYSEQQQPSRRERVQEIALVAAAGAVFLALLVVVLLVFVRYPLPTLAGLAAMWAIGFVTLTVKQRRAERRERELRRSIDEHTDR
jgi:Flp pilus assembly protein TadB